MTFQDEIESEDFFKNFFSIIKFLKTTILHE